jgi:signal transduction histidine kinase
MGLAIAKKAVENMQGSIGLESSLGNGTKIPFGKWKGYHAAAGNFLGPALWHVD